MIKNIIIITLLIIILTGCNQVPKKLEGNRLMVMDKFWKALGSGEKIEETKQDN